MPPPQAKGKGVVFAGLPSSGSAEMPKAKAGGDIVVRTFDVYVEKGKAPGTGKGKVIPPWHHGKSKGWFAQTNAKGMAKRQKVALDTFKVAKDDETKGKELD